MSMLTALKQSVAATVFGCVVALSPATASAEPLRVAFGDIPSVETLHLLIAFERAKEAGLELDVTYLKTEDIAAQAVVSGQADIGVGAPYALVQKVKAPIRIFFQLTTLQFFPVVTAEYYKSWKDLDGQEIAVHSRGSGTEAIMQPDGQEERHRIFQHLLRAGLRGAHRRAAAGQRQGDDRRCLGQAHPRGAGAGQVPVSAARRRGGDRRGACSPTPTT